jgi:hypothetical protein
MVAAILLLSNRSGADVRESNTTDCGAALRRNGQTSNTKEKISYAGYSGEKNDEKIPRYYSRGYR